MQEESRVNKLEHLLKCPEEYMVQAGGEYELISEMSFLRSIIKYRGFKIVIYGAGSRCEFLLRWLQMENIKVEFILDNNVDKHGTEIGDHAVYHIDKIPGDLKDEKYLAIISTIYFETETGKILYSLFRTGIENYIYPFDKKYGLAPYRYHWASYWFKNNKKLINIYNSLADEESREAYYEFIRTILTNQVYRGKQKKSAQKYFEGYIPLDNEVLLNIGSYVGDTIFYFIENRNEQFEKIYACEGNTKIYERLKNNLTILPPELHKRIELNNVFLDSENSIHYDDKRVTLINMDVEGNEKEVIIGLQDCIRNNRAVVAVCAYHKPEDIVELPLLIHQLFENYVIIFKKYVSPYDCHLECGELVMYAIPEERYDKKYL